MRGQHAGLSSSVSCDFFYPLEWKSSWRKKKKTQTDLTSLCWLIQLAYLFDAWLILTFALKLSVIVCICDLHFCFVTRIEGKWILTFTSILHLRSIKYAAGATERCTTVQKKKNKKGNVKRVSKRTKLLIAPSKVVQVMAY